MSTKAFAIIAGAGSGTGASVARKFAQSYAVALLARNPESYQSLVNEINANGGRAIGIASDVSSQDSIRVAFDQIKREYEGASCAAAIYQASGGFVKKPFLEMQLEEFDKSWIVTVKGAMIFSQAVLPLLLKHAEVETECPPTLIFTGATASLKANAQMSSFAAPKWALRALSTSLAREFAPKGVHVVHAIIDGPIDIPKSQPLLTSLDENARIGPSDIAETYWHLHTQTRRGFTNEIDIRSMLEKW